MNRRELLKKAGFLTTSVAVFGLAGCNSNESDQEAQPASSPVVLRDYRFPQGVMAADPKPGSVILWTRVVAPDDDPVTQIPAGRADVAVTLELSATSNFAELLIRPVKLNARAIYDNTIRHKLTGLKPATTYYYRFRAGKGASRTGCFKTAPAVNADIGALDFAFMACQDWSVNHWVGISALVQKNLDFVVHLGDYIYEAAGDSYQSENVEARHDQLHIPSNSPKPGSTTAKVAMTTEDYRYLYKKYRTDPRLQELHAKFALIAIWDDHEFSDDCWQDNQTYTNSDTVQLNRRRSANRAWFEFMPADIPELDESAADNFKTVKIYRDLQFGKLAHFVMTDERLYRADHVIPENADNPLTPGVVDEIGSIGSRYFVPEDSFDEVQKLKMLGAVQAKFNDPSTGVGTKALLGSILTKLTAGTPMPLTAQEAALFGDVGLGLISILGKTQRDWWKGKMKNSTATWKFWGNEVSLLRMALNLKALPSLVAAGEKDPALKAMLNTYLINADQWDGYSAERANLTGFLAANNIKNVVAVTGDIHAFFAGEVAANYADYVEGNAAMVDLVTAGISSSSFWSYLSGVVKDFEKDVNDIKTARTSDPTGYINKLESGDNPFAALRPLVYVCANMLVYQQIKGMVLATPGLDLTTEAGRQFAYRQVFEAYLAHEVPVVKGGFALQNTLNETMAGDMGQIIQAIGLELSKSEANPSGTLPANPYTGDPVAAPPKQNPWIKYVETKTQGFITVRVTPAKVEATFHHTASLSMHPSAANVVVKTKTVTVNNGSTQLTVS